MAALLSTWSSACKRPYVLRKTRVEPDIFIYSYALDLGFHLRFFAVYKYTI